MKRILVVSLIACVLLMPARTSFAQEQNATTAADAGSAVVVAAYSHILDDYYRQVAPQTVLGGARAALLSLLAARGVEDASVPEAFAVGDRTRDAALVSAMIDAAAAESHAPTRAELRYAAISGMADALGDPYSHYYAPETMKSVASTISGVFGGVGMFIRRDDAGRVVVTPNPGSAAMDAGVRAGDVLEQIDGKSTAGRSSDELADAIRGIPGTTLTLQIRRDGTPDLITLHVTRRQIEPHYVQSRMMSDIEYIRVTSFAANVTDDVRHALQDAVNGGARRCILDLRNNSGGLTSAAVGLTSLFITNGNVFTVITRDGKRDPNPVKNDWHYSGTLVVLVNGQSRSAAEITASALQDAHRATLVGMTTFGKGVAQKVITLPDQSGLVLTEWSYLTRNGRNINHRGVVPDVRVEQAPDESILLTPDDHQLSEAESLARTPAN